MARAMQSDLKIAATASELGRISRWLKELGETLEIDKETLFAFEICSDEAVGNIIRHAYSESQDEHITLRFLIEPDQYVLEIEDDGAPFNPLLAPVRELPAELEEAKIGGLGIRLIRNYCAQIAYQRVADQNFLSFTLPRIGA